MRKKPKIKSHRISRDVIEKSWDLQVTKNPGIFYPGIFQKLRSRDFWSRDFLIPGLSRDIPGPRYPVHTSIYNLPCEESEDLPENLEFAGLSFETFDRIIVKIFVD